MGSILRPSKMAICVLMLMASIALWPSRAFAQSQPSAAERVTNLKLQLLELTAKEDETRLRAAQLDEALKPENIERSLAGVGSTRPEELREQRRRQLEIQKAAVTTQLQQLAAQRARLESAIATAEAQAYQDSAKGTPLVENQMFGAKVSVRLLVALGVVALGVIAFSFVMFRRLRLAARSR